MGLPAHLPHGQTSGYSKALAFVQRFT